MQSIINEYISFLKYADVHSSDIDKILPNLDEVISELSTDDYNNCTEFELIECMSSIIRNECLKKHKLCTSSPAERKTRIETATEMFFLMKQMNASTDNKFKVYPKLDEWIKYRKEVLKDNNFDFVYASLKTIFTDNQLNMLEMFFQSEKFNTIIKVNGNLGDYLIGLSDVINKEN